VQDFRSSVCLHGHTIHSQECLSFLPTYLHKVPGVSQIVSRYESRHKLDFGRAYWTPPLTPASALQLEQKQILNLGLHPIVSLTDHDDIEAGMMLRLTSSRSDAPVSVEWTVPYAGSILHLGIHNLPVDLERRWMGQMAAYTANPQESWVPEILSTFAQRPEVLVVLNHPFWLEEGVTETAHEPALKRFLAECLTWIHAFELNGTRSWKENVAVVELAERYNRPLISGGDRHACEPAACLNLTNADSFSEFAGEVREGHSTVLFMPQYRDAMAHRILQASWEILRRYPEYPGREQWTDRIFYRGQDEIARPLSVVWEGRVPWMLDGVTRLLHAFATTRLRAAFRAGGEMMP
jgi:hypothetical protein